MDDVLKVDPPPIPFAAFVTANSLLRISSSSLSLKAVKLCEKCAKDVKLCEIDNAFKRTNIRLFHNRQQ